MLPKRKTKSKPHPIERVFTVTLVGGTKHTFIGTRLEQTSEYSIIWNEQISVRSYRRSEYEDIR
jgi:hypothetical protein